jgi:hypothetical protein
MWLFPSVQQNFNIKKFVFVQLPFAKWMLSNLKNYSISKDHKT